MALINIFNVFSRSRLVECSARTNYNIREVFKTFLFLSKIAPNVSSRSSSRRTSDEESKLSRNGNGCLQNDKTVNFPRSDEIILTSPHQNSPTSRSRWGGSLKTRPSSSNTNSSIQKSSPLRRNMSAYGRPGKFGQNKDGEEVRDVQMAGSRRKTKSGNKMNGIEPLNIHFEQVNICFR